jgi:hypothetical protein
MSDTKSLFTITVKEADVRYIKCNAPSNYTHTVQDRVVALSKHDHQMPGNLSFRECTCKHIELRSRAPSDDVPNIYAFTTHHDTNEINCGIQNIKKMHER